MRSKAALAKAARHMLDDGTPAPRFATLMAELATIVRNTYGTPHAGPDAPSFEVLTKPNSKQQRALELVQQIPDVYRSRNPFRSTDSWPSSRHGDLQELR